MDYHGFLVQCGAGSSSTSIVVVVSTIAVGPRRQGGRRRRPDQPLRERQDRPSVEAVVRLAEIFDVSGDYLVLDDAPRRPVRQASDELADRLADLDKLSDADHATLLHILDGLLADTRIRAALDNAS